MERPERPQAIVVMGVSGCGKTTTARGLARRLGWAFAEADDFHPVRNIRKMERGTPLDDRDRAPWLDALRAHIDAALARGQPLVVTCSALKRAYRDRLRTAAGPVRFLHLAGERAVIARRMAGRSGHFMPAALLASQFEALEPLGDDEPGVTVSVRQPPDAVLAEALAGLGLAPLVGEG